MGTMNNLSLFKCQRMAKMNDREPKERLGTSRSNDVFLKIYPYLTFMQSKIKICKADFSQTKKNVKSKIAQNLSY